MSLTLKTYFIDFLREIRLTEAQISELKAAHNTLRNRLESDSELKNIVVGTFLQGSYKRSTAVRPKNGQRSDVDIIIVTNLDKDTITPEEALDKFEPFLEKYYSGKYRKQGRSWGIEMSHVDLDIVPTSAPSEIEKNSLANNFLNSDDGIEFDGEQNFYSNDKDSILDIFEKLNASSTWKEEPLYIPDCEAETWDKTHPLEQIRWTIEKNRKCNKHYVNVVKALKWWRKEMYPELKHPKSYPLEHFIGDCCPDNIESVAEGIVLSLENIVNNYEKKPILPDRGVPEHDVFSRLTEEDYESFYENVKEAAKIARAAYDSENIKEAALKWRELFGNKFPLPPETVQKFTPRKEDSSNLEGGRFA